MEKEKSLFERLDDLKIDQSNILEKIDFLDSRLSELGEEQKKSTKGAQYSSNAIRIEPNNQLSRREILQLFLKKATKYWRWFGGPSDFNKEKTQYILSIVLLFVIGIVSTIISTSCFGVYSTFTLFENIWLIFGIIYLSQAIKAKILYKASDLANCSPYKHIKDEYDMYFFGKEKVVYRVFRWITIISIICNIIAILSSGRNLKILAFIFELLFLGTIVLCWLMCARFFCMYDIIWVRGTKINSNEQVTLIKMQGNENFMTEEELRKKIPYLF